jgi:hypothetical protein
MYLSYSSFLRTLIPVVGVTSFVFLSTEEAWGQTRRVAARLFPQLAQETETLPSPGAPESIYPRPTGPVIDLLPGDEPQLEPYVEQPGLPAWGNEPLFSKEWGFPQSQGHKTSAWFPTAPTPHISYVHHPGLRKSCCARAAEIQTVLKVRNPQTACDVLVPVCLPACCGKLLGAHGRRALLGRGIVHYDWSCGFHLKVIFDRHDQVTVHYYGR